MVDLGLDAARVHGHIANRTLYDAADERGVLLLQDFPLQWSHARSVRTQAIEQARAAVDWLGHHPSIALWSAHDDPSANDAAIDTVGWRRRTQRLVAQQLPSWNKSVLDRWVKRAFERADGTREVVAHSGVPPHLPLLDGTDSHLWYGWRRGEAEDLAHLAARIPRLVRFVSAFGSDSPPESAPFLDDQLRSHRWPDLDWDRLAEDDGYQGEVFERTFPPSDFASFEAWRDTAQHYQAHVLKVQIEALRRLKYRPTGGFCFSTLADPAPAISSAILDHERRRKVAYDVVAAACAPVLVVADPLPDVVRSGDVVDVDVHVVSDLRTGIEFAVVDAVMSWPGGEQRWRFGGPVPADEVVKVGHLEFEVPEVDELITLELTLAAGAIRSTNHSTTVAATR